MATFKIRFYDEETPTSICHTQKPLDVVSKVTTGFVAIEQEVKVEKNSIKI
jgi:hypothetical protein